MGSTPSPCVCLTLTLMGTMCCWSLLPALASRGFPHPSSACPVSGLSSLCSALARPFIFPTAVPEADIIRWAPLSLIDRALKKRCSVDAYYSRLGSPCLLGKFSLSPRATCPHLSVPGGGPWAPCFLCAAWAATLVHPNFETNYLKKAAIFLFRQC